MSLSKSVAIPIQHGVLNTPTHELQTGINSCLLHYLNQLETLDTTDINMQSRLFAEIHGFLESLAAVSKTCNDLFKANLAKPHLDLKQQLTSLLFVVKELINSPQVCAELGQTMQQAQNEANVAKANMSAQLRSALAERMDGVEKAHKARIDSAPHDQLRYIGHLVELLLNINYLVPVDEEYYVRGFTYNQTQPIKRNSYEQYLRNKNPSDTTIYSAKPTT